MRYFFHPHAAPTRGKNSPRALSVDSIRHEQISDEGEFILNIQIDKVEWLKTL